MKQRTHYFSTLIVFMLATLFLYTGFSKLLYPEQLYHTIKRITVFAPAAEAVTLFVPLIQIAVACLLLLPPLREAGMLLSCMLLLVFTAYTGFVVIAADQRPCTCAGIIESLSWKQHFSINTLLLLLNLWLILPLIRFKDFIAITR